MNAIARTAVARFIAWWKACVERRRQQHLLVTFDEHKLRDIGLDEQALRDSGIARAQAWFEAEKKRFWRT